MLGRDGPENLRILKKRQLRLDDGGRELSFLPLRWRLSFPGFARRRWIEILNTTPRIGMGVSRVRIVSLSSCRHEPKSEMNKLFVPETTESACICIVYLCMYYYYGYEWYATISKYIHTYTYTRYVHICIFSLYTFYLLLLSQQASIALWTILLISKSWWWLLKPERLTLSLHHNKFI